MRIVSLLPSATEIVCALGLRENLVARSHECDFPEDVGKLPAVTRPRLNVAGSSREIHDRVTALSGSAEGVYALDVESIRALAPTHLVTQAQCDVCAVGMADVERALAAWPADPPAVAALHPTDLPAVFEDIRRTGAFLGAVPAAERLLDRMTARLDVVRHAAAGPRPRVALLEWTDPLMGAGNWMPELVRIAGGEPVLGDSGRHSRWISFEEVEAVDPEVVVVVPCGFGLDRAADELRALLRDPRARQWRAFRSGRAFAADGNAYFNRPGPRLADSAEILGAILEDGGRGQGASWISAEVACASC